MLGARCAQDVGKLRGCHSAKLARTLSVEESARSSPTMGGGSGCLDWRGRGATSLADSEDDGESPGSMEGYVMATGAPPAANDAHAPSPGQADACMHAARAVSGPCSRPYQLW